MNFVLYYCHPCDGCLVLFSCQHHGLVLYRLAGGKRKYEKDKETGCPVWVSTHKRNANSISDEKQKIRNCCFERKHSTLTMCMGPRRRKNIILSLFPVVGCISCRNHVLMLRISFFRLRSIGKCSTILTRVCEYMMPT